MQSSRYYVVKDTNGFFWVNDSPDFEAKHPRDKDGKFSINKTSQAGLENKPLSQAERKLRFANLHRRLADGEDPAKIVKEGASVLRGTYNVSLPQIGNAQVIFSGSAVRESTKYFKGKNCRFPKEYFIQAAKRQLALYEHFEDILDKGARKNNEWRNSPDHHAGLEFLTIYKRMKIDDKYRLATIDLCRPKGSAAFEGTGARVHNMSTSGNPGFRTKLKHWNDAELVPAYEVYCIRIE